MLGGNLLIVFAASRALQLGKHQDDDGEDSIFCQFKDGGRWGAYRMSLYVSYSILQRPCPAILCRPRGLETNDPECI